MPLVGLDSKDKCLIDARGGSRSPGGDRKQGCTPEYSLPKRSGKASSCTWRNKILIQLSAIYSTISLIGSPTTPSLLKIGGATYWDWVGRYWWSGKACLVLLMCHHVTIWLLSWGDRWRTTSTSAWGMQWDTDTGPLLSALSHNSVSSNANTTSSCKIPFLPFPFI